MSGTLPTQSSTVYVATIWSLQKIEPPLATECFFNPSSYMLEQLENILESLLTKIDENESYDLSYIVEALEAMAESEEWEDSREKILLLFTDDQNSDRTSSDMTRIDNAITQMGSNGIKVVILDFGDGAGQLKRSNENEFMNQLNVRSILADVQDDLQRLSFNITTELLSKTAAKTVPTAADRDVVYSSPYMDFGGASGEIITIGQPIYEPNGTVFGAVGVDLVVPYPSLQRQTALLVASEQCEFAPQGVASSNSSHTKSEDYLMVNESWMSKVVFRPRFIQSDVIKCPHFRSAIKIIIRKSLEELFPVLVSTSDFR